MAIRFYFNLPYLYCKELKARCHWLVTEILLTWKAKIRRSMVQGQPRQMVFEIPHLQNNQNKIYWRCGSISRAPALQVQSLENFLLPAKGNPNLMIQKSSILGQLRGRKKNLNAPKLLLGWLLPFLFRSILRINSQTLASPTGDQKAR
jgi:hypothetical protein